MAKYPVENAEAGAATPRVTSRAATRISGRRSTAAPFGTNGAENISLLALVCHLFDRDPGGLRIEVVGRPDRQQGLVVQLVPQRNAGRYVQRDHLVVGQ